jgi:uncharacterized Tic20 family protein
VSNKAKDDDHAFDAFFGDEMCYLARAGEVPIGPLDTKGRFKAVSDSGGPAGWRICRVGSEEWFALEGSALLKRAWYETIGPQVAAPAARVASEDVCPERTLVAMHASVLLGFLIPFFGFALPFMLWNKHRGCPQCDAQGKEIANWVVFLTICLLASSAVSGCLSLDPVAYCLVFVVMITAFVYSLLGMAAAGKGTQMRYPIPFRVFR